LPALLHDHFAPPYPELAELLDMLLLVKSGLALIRLRDELKYSEDQPRWPEGDPRGGQWRPKEGGEGDSGSDPFSGFGEAPDGTLIEPVGGIPEDKLNWTTRQFMSAYCKGNIREVVPGQFLNMPIADVLALAQNGSRPAQTCLKLLKQKGYRK
jgi:hypothetical protein